MRVSTVNLSPAVDRTYYTDGFCINGVNRARLVKVNAGGKGLNFAAVLGLCGAECEALGFLGRGGEFIEEFLESRSIKSNFVHTDAPVRVNIKICDEKNGTYTDLNENAACASEDELARLYETVEKSAEENDVLYVGGSLPYGMKTDIYKNIVEIGKKHGACTVADASGEAMKNLLEAHPDIIKPNEKEAEEILGTEVSDESDALKAALKLRAAGAKTVILTLGGQGAMCAAKDGVYRVISPKVTVKSTVGAGDTFLAGFLYGMKYGTETALRYAASFAAAKIVCEGTDIPCFEALCERAGTINVTKI